MNLFLSSLLLLIASLHCLQAAPAGCDDGGDEGSVGTAEVEGPPESIKVPTGTEGTDDETGTGGGSIGTPEKEISLETIEIPSGDAEDRKRATKRANDGGNLSEKAACPACSWYKTQGDESNPDSTVCKKTLDNSVTEYGITNKNINAIVKQHNNYRAEISGKNLVKMKWDEKLACVAQHLAQSCHSGHDAGKGRKVPGYTFGVGQNWAGGYSSWTNAIDAWHSEEQDFVYNGDNSVVVVGHFTQIINAKAILIGCGYAYCPNNSMKQNYVCNYAYGQTSGDIKKPYVKGDNCALCPNNCNGAGTLCNCGNKYCNHGGVLNPDGCKCECVSPYSGTNCDDVASSVCGSEPTYCGPSPYDLVGCATYSNLPGACPITCKVCG